MRKVKPYNFKGVDCYDLNSLAEEYIKSYFEAIDDIFTNAKALLKFVARCRKDKAFTKEIAEILYTSKYRNNALTFIIYAFTGYGRVIINGSELSFKEFLEAFKEHKEEENNILYAFMEDHGISKTYANINHDDRLAKEAASIEANYNLAFTRLYLESYYSYKETQSFENRVSNLILANEECFRKASELCRSDAFQLAIAHKIGFKEAISIHKEQNPLFESVKILKQTNEFQDEELLKLITDTFYWWLLDNIDRYVAKGKDSKKLFNRIKEVQKQYSKYEALIKKKKIYDLALESMADMSKEMYACYLEFVELYRADQIIVKKKFKGYDYVFDKPYCNTFITQSYMDGRIITIDPLKEEVEEPVMELKPTEEINEDSNDDKAVSDDNKDSKKKEKKMKKEKPKKEKMSKKEKKALAKSEVSHVSEESEADKVDVAYCQKKINKSMRGKGLIVFEMVVIAIAVIALVTAEWAFKVDLGLKPFYSSEPIFYGFIGAFVILIVLLPILSHKLKQSYKASNNILYIQNTKKADKLTVEQEKKLNKLKNTEEKNARQSERANIILSALIVTALSLMVACFGILAVVLLNHYGYLAELHFVEKMTLQNMILSLSCAMGCGLIFGFFKKYKGMLSIILVDILALAGSMAVLYFIA